MGQYPAFHTASTHWLVLTQQRSVQLDSATVRHSSNMTQVQGSNLLDVLKKKMRQTKEEMEKYKEESEDMARKLQVEIMRREEAEGEVAALNRRIQLLEEDLERSEERLATATQKLAEASHAADESERMRKVLENRSLSDE